MWSHNLYYLSPLSVSVGSASLGTQSHTHKGCGMMRTWLGHNRQLDCTQRKYNHNDTVCRLHVAQLHLGSFQQLDSTRIDGGWLRQNYHNWHAAADDDDDRNYPGLSCYDAGEVQTSQLSSSAGTGAVVVDSVKLCWATSMCSARHSVMSPLSDLKPPSTLSVSK